MQPPKQTPMPSTQRAGDEPADCQVAFQPMGKRVTVAMGATLLEAGRAAGLVLSANCGGIGVCRRCRVSVVSGEMEPPVPAETTSLSARDLAGGERLACRARIRSDVAVHVPATFLVAKQRLQLEGEEPPLVCDPVVALSQQPALGLAVDLGCTKIAGYLVDLHTGAQLAAEGIPNPQISFGEDLISRLMLANSGTEQAARLAGSVRSAIDALAHNLCAQVGAQSHQIVDACIVGNSAMTHLLLALPVRQLLHAPYVAAIDTALDVDATELDLHLAPGARVHVPPSIGGFVGADHVAMILARSIDRAEATVVGIDIGTNTEIVLAKPSAGLMVNTSVPSGPAFEGGHIHDGMRAAAGAIEKVRFVDDEVRWTTIGGAAPIGLCGSGVIDLVAQLWQSGRVNARGAFLPGDERIRDGRDGREFVLVPASESGHGRDIVFTQHDVTEVQLAKAAICAGIQSLLELTHTPREEVAEVVVAGAFGSHLDLASAVVIGALPELPNARYRQVGNAAGVGAKMTLVSGAARERAREIARRAQRIDLKGHGNFNRLLARATRFPHTVEVAAMDQRASNDT